MASPRTGHAKAFPNGAVKRGLNPGTKPQQERANERGDHREFRFAVAHSPRDLLFRFFHPPLKQAISISAFIQPISLIDFLSRQDGELLFFLSWWFWMGFCVWLDDGGALMVLLPWCCYLRGGGISWSSSSSGWKFIINGRREARRIRKKYNANGYILLGSRGRPPQPCASG